jgi:hypothetical protein
MLPEQAGDETRNPAIGGQLVESLYVIQNDREVPGTCQTCGRRRFHWRQNVRAGGLSVLADQFPD